MNSKGTTRARPPATIDRPDTGQPSDRELLDWYDLIVRGFHATKGRILNELDERFDLDQGPLDVLVRLLMAGEHRMPMTHLAREADMSTGGFTKLADRLCSAGLVQRVACHADRRVTYLELTGEGQDMAEAIVQAAAQILRHQMLAPLGRERLSNLAKSMQLLHSPSNG